MKFIIGGAFQGKRAFAECTFSLTEEDIYTCSGSEIDFSRPCIDRIEEFTLACIRENKDPLAYFQAHEEQWKNSILICQDIFCGVVPLGAEMRLWRNSTGKLAQYLSGKAESVSRIFCGLEQKLK